MRLRNTPLLSVTICLFVDMARNEFIKVAKFCPICMTTLPQGEPSTSLSSVDLSPDSINIHMTTLVRFLFTLILPSITRSRSLFTTFR